MWSVEIYKELMNQGFLIWSLKGTEKTLCVYLQKVPTSNNMKMSITDDIQPVTNLIKFNSYEEALKEAIKLAGL